MKFLRALRQRGYESTVITSHDYMDLPDLASYDGIPVHRFPFRKALRSRDPQQLLETRHRVAAFKRILKPDLIHVNAVSASVLFHLQTTDAHRAPSVVRVNQEFLSEECAAPNSLMRRVLLAADWVTCVSAALLEQIQERIPEIRPRSSVIYSGLVDSPEASRPMHATPPILLCLGRLVSAKGFDLAVEAFTAIVDRFPGVRLIVAGDGPARAELKRRTLELGLAESVEFLGWVCPDAVVDLLNAATIVLMPSRREGLPVVAVQSALAGKPIVAARVSGLPEVVVNGETGFLVEREDTKGLAAAISYLLDRPEIIATMGEATRRRARELFSEERCVHAYDALYRKFRQGNHASSDT